MIKYTPAFQKKHGDFHSVCRFIDAAVVGHVVNGRGFADNLCRVLQNTGFDVSEARTNANVITQLVERGSYATDLTQRTYNFTPRQM